MVEHEENKRARRKDIRPGDHYNILLATRGELLHTWLLGPDKYVWYSTTKDWKEGSESGFTVWLESLCLDGLSIPPPRASYMMKCKNSLIGKHFKSLQQLAIFGLHNFCPSTLFEVWKATGELGAQLYIPEFRNMNLYLSDLEILIGNFLDAWAEFDPRRIITKAKLHVLVHLPDNIRRFGPAVIFATEVFECYNAIFPVTLHSHLAVWSDSSICGYFKGHISLVAKDKKTRKRPVLHWDDVTTMPNSTPAIPTIILQILSLSDP
ncbi:hypothetical protein DFH05DRAFT_1460400 [Lentinula detonsa]|uniref:Uncharacterized protein n=1 Tax=Lentinula detonsa TaxID=2804962 RepID=A0A9W8P071_9AGAR|nr:hypothetical protein DFH05DRAFT_1460400 [Lentinula detonsa]